VSAEVWVFDVAGLGGDGSRKREDWRLIGPSLLGNGESGAKLGWRESVEDTSEATVESWTKPGNGTREVDSSSRQMDHGGGSPEGGPRAQEEGDGWGAERKAAHSLAERRRPRRSAGWWQ
jgi:hypothetical protein